MGILTAMIQGGYVRRRPKNASPNRDQTLVLQGTTSCAIGLFLIGYMAQTKSSIWALYGGVACLALTNGTVVTCLTALASYSKVQDPQNNNASADRGRVLGVFRSIGQLGRCLGPLVACSLYWVLGSVQLYVIASTCMFLISGWLFIVFARSVAELKKIKIL